MKNSILIAYLSCPYSHSNPQIRLMRVQLVNAMAYHLIKRKIYVYSPLTHNAPLIALGGEGGWDIWGEFDLAMIARCHKFIILKLPGWESSKGVAAETEAARKLKLPIEEMEFPEVCLNLIKDKDIIELHYKMLKAAA
ncbi:MAG: DUF1937 family protein [Alphaproteobacteria bacterium]|nr:DUF1937 family protein [Alphaproteobacteria bacterium]